MIQKLLLCTDLDRTLVPNGKAPESPGARPLFRRLAARPEITLAYVSGRDAGRIKTVIEEFGLPNPDHVVADVGSSIYGPCPGQEWIRNPAWDVEVGRDWDHSGAERLDRALSAVTILKPQEASKQGRFKRSYYFSSAVSEREIETRVHDAISGLNIPVTLVYSIDEPRNIGLLDVLPERANKLHAVNFLMESLNFRVDQTLFSGDSGNDLSVLTSPVPAVLVANASGAVRSEALRRAAKAGTQRQLYLADGALMDLNGNYAAGVLEGICHFYPFAFNWISSSRPENDSDD